MTHAAAQEIPVILDTDVGDDIDDTWAVAMALAHPQLDVRLIVTASGDTYTKARLLAKMLDRMGHADVPIGIGVKDSDSPINQAAWLGDYELGEFPGTVYEDGVGALIETVLGAEGTIPIVVIGPQTNLKAALERDPAIAEKARIVTMAGSVFEGYQGASEPDAEWNVRRDVAAAKAVFAAPWDITMAPLDVCGTLILKGERYRTVARSVNPLAKIVIANYQAWRNYSRYPKGQSSVLFDTVAIYLAGDDAFCEMKTIRLRVDDAGKTVPDEDGRPVRCALDWKDRPAFETFLVELLTKQ